MRDYNSLIRAFKLLTDKQIAIMRSVILELKVPELAFCWVWVGSMRNNRGAIKYGGRTIDAHRVSYMEFIGDIPDDMCIFRKCKVATCVNPDHLYLGYKGEEQYAAEAKKKAIHAKLTKNLKTVQVRQEEGCVSS